MKLLSALLALGLLPSLGPVAPPRRPRPATPAASAPDSTTVRLLYGSGSADLNELMSRVLNVEKHRLLLHDRRLAGRYLHLTWQEYRRGVPGPEKELTGDRSLTRLDSAGRLPLTIYAHATADGQVENTFVLPRASVPKRFAAVPGQAGSYSLRFDIHPCRRAPDQTGATPQSPAEEFNLPLGAPAVLAVYTLPYEHAGLYLYCGLAQSRVPVAEWYSRFRVLHYVVYRARVE